MEADEESIKIREESTVENQDLSFLHSIVESFISEYGWYLLFICVGIYLLIQEFGKRRTRVERGDSGTVEDSSSVIRRQEGLEAARRRMQEELDTKSAEYKEKKLKVEEEKRRQKIEMWESMKKGESYKGNAATVESTEEASSSTVTKRKTEKKPLRSTDYSPLSGGGGGTCAWRPGRRGPSAGG